MIRFVDEHRDRFGVEPIIGVLRATDAGFLSVSGYYAAKTRPPSARSIADAALCEQIAAVHQANYSVYGVRKMHDALHRAGVPIGRDHLARLMRRLGLRGVRRGKPKRTTIAETAAARPADLVRRQFHAGRPNQLWVCDLTYIRTWVGFAYLALVIDVYSRRLVGWALTTHLRTDLPLEALEMAVWARNDRLDGLIHHSDAGSQGGFDWSSQHLDHGGVRWDDRGSRCRRRRPERDGSGPRIGRCGRRCARRAVRSRLELCSGSSGA